MDEKHNQAIFLHGPSSSGKSTLAKQLQRALSAPYLHIGIDKIIGMMPAKCNDWTGRQVEPGFWWQLSDDPSGAPLAHIQLGPFAQAMSDFLKQVVVLALRSGHRVIVDEVCVVDGSLDAWRARLSPYRVVYVGLKASTDTLEEREQARGDRMSGSARAQNRTIHRHQPDDLVLDTGILTPDACVSRIVERIGQLK